MKRPSSQEGDLASLSALLRYRALSLRHKHPVRPENANATVITRIPREWVGACGSHLVPRGGVACCPHEGGPPRPLRVSARRLSIPRRPPARDPRPAPPDRRLPAVPYPVPHPGRRSIALGVAVQDPGWLAGCLGLRPAEHRRRLAATICFSRRFSSSNWRSRLASSPASRRTSPSTGRR
jgi:hypothetical protein